MSKEENHTPIIFQEELFAEATQAALDALSQILQQEVSLGTYALGKIHHWPTRWKEIYSQPREGFWLQTNLQGELEGHSFLWIGKEEARQLGEKVLKNTIENSENTEEEQEILNEELLESFLLELDNILSAHFIKFWANQNQLKVYGDVPDLYKDLLPKVLEESLAKESKLSYQLFYLEFICLPLEINLEFTWLIHTSEN